MSLVAIGLMVVCSGLTIAPDLLDQALAVSGRVVADTLARRQSQALKERLEQARGLLNEARSERESLAQALEELKGRRTNIRSRLDHDHALLEQAAEGSAMPDAPGIPPGRLGSPWENTGAGQSVLQDAFASNLERYLESRQHLDRFDEAVEDMSTALAHADSVLAQTNSLVEARAGELAILRAAAARRALDRALATLDDSLADRGRPALIAERLASDTQAWSAP
jgi:DNA repair exonuclease SbcCD ATPase subunit